MLLFTWKSRPPLYISPNTSQGYYLDEWLVCALNQVKFDTYVSDITNWNGTPTGLTMVDLQVCAPLRNATSMSVTNQHSSKSALIQSLTQNEYRFIIEISGETCKWGVWFLMQNMQKATFLWAWWGNLNFFGCPSSIVVTLFLAKQVKRDC